MTTVQLPSPTVLRAVVGLTRIREGQDAARKLAESECLNADVFGTPEQAQQLRYAATIGLSGAPIVRSHQTVPRAEQLRAIIDADLTAHGDANWTTRLAGELDELSDLSGISNPAEHRTAMGMAVAESLGRKDLSDALLAEWEATQTR